MENETQNQDTQAAPQQQQPVVEESQAAPPQQATDEAQAATSEVVHDDPGIPQQEEQQQQGIAVGEPDPSSPGGEPVSEEGLNPAETPDPAVTMTSDDLVGSDPKVTMNPEDLSGPESSENPSDFLAGDETNSYIELGEPDFTSEGGDAGWISDVPPVSEDEWLDIWNVEDDSTSIGLDIDGQVKDYADDWSWGSGPSDAEEIVSEDPAPGGYDDMLGISKEDIEGPSSDTDGDGASDLDETREDAAPGGYDGSGIAGGLDLDQDGVFDRIENNPDVSDGGGYTYDEGAYEDAEDAFEDLQDALQDGDEEDLAEALEELQGYLGGFDKGAEDEDPDPTGADTEEVPNTADKEAVDAPDASGAAVSGPAVGANAQEDPEDLGEGVMEDDGEGETNPADVDYQEILHDLDSGNLDDVREFLENLAGGGNDKEEEAQDTHDDAGNYPDMSGEDYTYDEDAYEDAEHAMKDLRHALKHGDEEDRAEALQKLQDYLGGFDKGAEEKTQDGIETQDDQIPSDSANDSDGDGTEGGILGLDHELDSDGDGKSDLFEALEDLYWQDSDSDGDPEEVPNTVDKEPVDAPDASGAAVSGPAVGAAGAAAAAGATAGEAGGLDEDLVKEVQGFFDDWFGGDEAAGGVGEVADGDGVFDKAIDAATQQAGGAIDDALGIEGSGNVIENIANGNFDGAIDAATEKAGGAIDEALGIEGSGKILDQVADGNFDGAIDAAAEEAGGAIDEALGIEGSGEILENVLDGDFDEALEGIGEKVGDFFEDIDLNPFW
jgi:hypothetical protein